MVLAAGEGESVAEFEEETLEPAHQCGFEFSFSDAFGDAEEVEHVRVADQLMSQVRITRW